ncbi:hypothetical protein EC973_002100 [Apophysomyces ossiformis]|uniref:proline--tRNA ligase n=1 Tax=Apophysomyces ossiformis TaxID=679940 RepID=A0A8H7BN51_9FUNG|nr:hypothetical protein EC973_002100 [Apophysomyces ossiformis]
MLKSSSGIYSLLPLGLRTVEKLERIIDEEMTAIGCQKLSLPTLLPPENWKKTGRWSGAKGEFFRLKDRKDSEMLLAPTHEEEITNLVASELRSSKQLPIRLYQIGRKYRDELRPRAGLLRGREFVMKDLYTFDASVEDAFTTYNDVSNAYSKIFLRIGVPFVVAEADSGNIGGSRSHEYHLLSNVGEDTLLTCSGCGYTANEELAVGHVPQLPSADISPKQALTTVADNTCDTLGLSRNHRSAVQFTFFDYLGTNKEGNAHIRGIAAAVTPKGRTTNVLKVQAELRKHLMKKQSMTDSDTLDMKVCNKPVEELPNHVFVDNAVAPLCETLSPNERFWLHEPNHFRIAEAGDLCASCSGHHLTSVKAIEVGHTFYLGTKYSSALQCDFKPSNPKADKVPAEMGCYGIGITRLLAAVAEASFDDRGIVWPRSIAPYRVCIVTTDDKNPELQQLADTIYDKLENLSDTRRRGLSRTPFYDNVVIDDRRSGFGSKMKDAELIGYPLIVVLGPKALSRGVIELHERIKGEQNKRAEVSVENLENWVLQRFSL